MLYALKKHGDKAVIHGLRGKPSNRRIAEKIQQKAIKILSMEEYAGFGGWWPAGRWPGLWTAIRRRRTRACWSGGCCGTGACKRGYTDKAGLFQTAPKTKREEQRRGKGSGAAAADANRPRVAGLPRNLP